MMKRFLFCLLLVSSVSATSISIDTVKAASGTVNIKKLIRADSVRIAGKLVVDSTNTRALIVNGSTVAPVTYGTTAGTACQGNDSRLSDARTPSSAYPHGVATGYIPYATSSTTLSSSNVYIDGSSRLNVNTTTNTNAATVNINDTANPVGLSVAVKFKPATGSTFAGYFNSNSPNAGHTNYGIYTAADSGTSNIGLYIVKPDSGANNYAIYSPLKAKSTFYGEMQTKSKLYVGNVPALATAGTNFITYDPTTADSNRYYLTRRTSSQVLSDIGAAPLSHNQAWSTITGTPASYTPSTHASTHGAGGSDPITTLGALTGKVAADSLRVGGRIVGDSVSARAIGVGSITGSGTINFGSNSTSAITVGTMYPLSTSPQSSIGGTLLTNYLSVAEIHSGDSIVGVNGKFSGNVTASNSFVGNLTGNVTGNASTVTNGVYTSDSRLSDARTPTAHNQAWSTITSTPTTINGYGITDAYTKTNLQTSGQASMHWGNITNTPSTYPPSTHDHDSQYLKLTGGTVNGDVTISGSTLSSLILSTSSLGANLKKVRISTHDGYGDGGDLHIEAANDDNSSKQSMLYISRSPTGTGAGIAKVWSNDIWHTGNLVGDQSANHNHDATYLKLTGGTLAGQLNASNVNGGTPWTSANLTPTPAGIGALALSGGTVTGQLLSIFNVPAVSNNSYIDAHIQIRTTDNSCPRIAFHRAGTDAIALYYAGGSNLRIKDWIGDDYSIWTTGNLTGDQSANHNHDATYYTKTQLQTNGQASVHWGNITNTPSTYTPSAHSHTEIVSTYADGNYGVRLLNYQLSNGNIVYIPCKYTFIKVLAQRNDGSAYATTAGEVLYDNNDGAATPCIIISNPLSRISVNDNTASGKLCFYNDYDGWYVRVKNNLGYSINLQLIFEGTH
jgi:cytoskeletal protein CcmA (bactofilin family)